MDLLRKFFGLREDQERLVIVPLLIFLFLITFLALRGCLPSGDAGALTYREVGNILPAASAPVIKDGTVDRVQLTGSYLSNDSVSLYIDDSFVETVETDRLGRWAYVATLLPGRHSLRVTAQRDGGTVESSTYPFILRADGTIDSDRSAVNYLPRIGENETLNGVPIEDPLFRSGLDGMAFTTGRIRLTGTSTPNSQVIVTTGERTIGRVRVEADGRWSLAGNFDQPGNYEVAVRSVESPDRPIDTINLTIGRAMQRPTIRLSPDRPDPNVVNLSGMGEPNVDLEIYSNGIRIGVVTTDAEGNWAFDYLLPDNETSFEFVAVANAEDALEPAISTATFYERAARSAQITLDPLTEESVNFDVGSDQTTVNLELSGTGEPVGAFVIILLNDNPLGETTIDTSRQWNFSTELGLPAGTYEVVALLSDESGSLLDNTTSAMLIVPEGEPEPVAVTLVDNQFDIDSATVGDDGTATGRLQLMGEALPAGSRVVFLLDGDEVGDAISADDGSYSFDFAYELEPGTYQLVSHVMDADGETLAQSNPTTIVIPEVGEEDAAFVTLDPLTEESASFDTSEELATSTLNLSGTGDPVGARVLIFSNDTQLGETTIDSSGLWNFSTEVAYAPGTYQIMIEVRDEDDNVLNTSETTTLIIPETDDSATTSTITLNDDGFNLDEATVADDGTATGTFELMGSVEPAGATVLVYLNNEQIGEFVSADGGAYSFAYDYELAPGTYELAVRIVGANGAAVAESETRTIVIEGESETDEIDDDAESNSSLRVVFASADGVDDADTTDDTDDDSDENNVDNATPTNSTLPAIELIVDASWSMTLNLSGDTRLDSGNPDSRIAIAREALDTLVDGLPDGLPIAVRGFGNRAQPLECQTALELPLQFLDREPLRETLLGIEPQFDANTPIAESLAAVAQDLAEFEGQKRVVLLTDGEENCDGDPAAAIQELRDAGIDVTIDIVGFAIGDPALQAQFEAWAELGGGNYYNADNAEDLATALQAAVGLPYRVLNLDGEEVASGSVGGAAIDLRAGSYTVEILTDPVQTFEVEVGDEPTVLTLE